MSFLDLTTACKNGDLEIVKSLLSEVDPSQNNNEPIRLASLNGHHLVVKELLLDKRVDPAIFRNYCIRYASHDGHLLVVKELLEDPRVDPCANNCESLRWASSQKHYLVKEMLLSNSQVIKYAYLKLPHYKSSIYHIKHGKPFRPIFSKI